MNCCTANGAQGLYYVWDSILHESENMVHVNLLMNRRSPSMDIASYLPYRGEVTLTVKINKSVSVRIPSWVEKENVKVSVDGQSRQLMWVNNYLLLPELLAGSVVTLQFPMKEPSEKYAVDSYEFRGKKYLGRQSYMITFRGNTAIDITPRDEEGHATYQRLYYRDADVSLIDVNDYVPKRRIEW